MHSRTSEYAQHVRDTLIEEGELDPIALRPTLRLDDVGRARAARSVAMSHDDFAAGNFERPAFRQDRDWFEFLGLGAESEADVEVA